MFEDINRKRDPIEIVFYCAGIPCGIFWVLWQSPAAAFILQAYLASAFVFIFYPFDMQKQNVRQGWFWKRLLSIGAVVHPVFLAGLWYLDMRYPVFVTGTGTVVFVGFVVGVVEMVVVGEIADQFPPGRSES